MAKQKWIFEPSQRWVRVEFGGEVIADSKNVMLMIESQYELHYYFPIDDVKSEFLVESDFSEPSKYKGDSKHWTVKVGDKVAENAVFTYADDAKNRPDLSNYVAFAWDKMDHWYEETEEVFLHPRSPYHRVDTLKSSRNIRVELDGVIIAETDQPYILFETNTRTRYYIAEEDVNTEYLTPTDHHTICPYKGVASYWSVNVNGKTYENAIWGYPQPIPETPKIQGHYSFYNKKFDIYIDGELEAKSRTVSA